MNDCAIKVYQLLLLVGSKQTGYNKRYISIIQSLISHITHRVTSCVEVSAEQLINNKNCLRSGNFKLYTKVREGPNLFRMLFIHRVDF